MPTARMTKPYIFSSACSGTTESSQAPNTTNGSMTPTILPSSRQWMLRMFSAASTVQARKPVAFKMDTELCSSSVSVPTGMQKMLPAKPVMACTV